MFPMFHVLYRLYSILSNNCTVDNKQTLVILQCACYMFRPLHRHAQGGLQQRNSVVPDSVKEVLTVGLNAV